MLFGSLVTDKLCNLIYVLSSIKGKSVSWLAVDITNKILNNEKLPDILVKVQGEILDSYGEVIVTREMCTGCETVLSRLPSQVPCVDFNDYKEFLLRDLGSQSNVVFPLLLRKGKLIVDGRSMDEFLKHFNVYKE